MFCPFCRVEETKVVDSRLVAAGDQIRRRRECTRCGERFTTFEVAEVVLPKVVKRDGRRSPFDEEKLRRGLQRALEKRPVGVDEIDAMIARILHRARASGEREITSEQIGMWVMEELIQVDKVAYVRFASVYRSFADISEFQEEIKRLESGRIDD